MMVRKHIRVNSITCATVQPKQQIDNEIISRMAERIGATLPPLALPSSIPAQAAPSFGRDGAPVFGGWRTDAASSMSSGKEVAGASQPATEVSPRGHLMTERT